MPLERLSSDTAPAHLPALTALLQDAVEGGASVGFLPPLAQAEAHNYWQNVIADLPAGFRRLLVWLEAGEVVGTVQLELAQKPNGRHRAEVQKLMVHRAWRGRGIAAALMEAVETEARQARRSLLVLDTVRGGTAERLYNRLGWIEAGSIPHFALSGGGILEATVIFYKLISA